MAFELAEIDPTTVPINLLNPRPGTKFGDRDFMDPWEAVKWIAIFRLILPDALFRLCGGRVENLGELQPLAVKAGRQRRDDGQLPHDARQHAGRGPRDVRGPRPEHRAASPTTAPTRGRTTAPAGSQGETPDVVEEYLDDAGTRPGAVQIEVHLWDPSTQLRFQRKEKVPPRPDGAPNRWPEGTRPRPAASATVRHRGR